MKWKYWNDSWRSKRGSKGSWPQLDSRKIWKCPPCDRRPKEWGSNMETRRSKISRLICNQNISERNAPALHHSHKCIWRQLEGGDDEFDEWPEDQLCVLEESALSLWFLALFLLHFLQPFLLLHSSYDCGLHDQKAYETVQPLLMPLFFLLSHKYNALVTNWNQLPQQDSEALSMAIAVRYLLYCHFYHLWTPESLFLW